MRTGWADPAGRQSSEPDSIGSEQIGAAEGGRRVGGKLGHHSRNDEGRQRQEHGGELPCGPLAPGRPTPPPSSTPIRSARSRGLARASAALGGVPVIEDMTVDACKTARRRGGGGPSSSIRRASTPRPRWRASRRPISPQPVKPSSSTSTPCWIRSMSWSAGQRGQRPVFRCLLTQTTRDPVIAKHIRAELAEAAQAAGERNDQSRDLPGGCPVGRHAEPDRQRGPPRATSPRSPMRSIRSSASGARREHEQAQAPKAITRPTDELRQAAAERLAEADRTALALS